VSSPSLPTVDSFTQPSIRPCRTCLTPRASPAQVAQQFRLQLELIFGSRNSVTAVANVGFRQVILDEGYKLLDAAFFAFSRASAMRTGLMSIPTPRARRLCGCDHASSPHPEDRLTSTSVASFNIACRRSSRDIGTSGVALPAWPFAQTARRRNHREAATGEERRDRHSFWLPRLHQRCAITCCGDWPDISGIDSRACKSSTIANRLPAGLD